MFLRQTRENGQRFNGTGSVGTARGRVDAIDYTYGELRIAVAPVDADTVGIRVDAQVPWTPPKPASERVPPDVRSVEVIAYQDSPDHVLARRRLSGPPARHLADLVNALLLDNRGTHHCPADVGGRRRLTFTTGHETVAVDGFVCGGVTMTVGNVEQPALLLSDALAEAVDSALGAVPSPSR